MYQKVRNSMTLSLFRLIAAQENSLDDEQLDDLMHSSQPSNGFWTHIGQCLFT
jgi:hypothetical protein